MKEMKGEVELGEVWTRNEKMDETPLSNLTGMERNNKQHVFYLFRSMDCSRSGCSLNGLVKQICENKECAHLVFGV